MQSVNPATGDVIGELSADSRRETDAALERASRAFDEWTDRAISERQTLIERAGAVLREHKRDYGETISREMGKPLSQAIGEVEKCAWVCDYYAERAAEHLQDDRIGSVPGVDSYVSYEPLGPVLAVMPWNYPFWQVFRFAAPALTAGNVGLLKHASNVPRCALAIQDVFEEAGYPDGVFSSLLVDSDRVDDLIADDRVRAVTLTGSDRAGRAVAASAGRNLKKTVLELGGSDPFVVLEDADLDRAAAVGARARTQNSGQSCIAAKRFVVVEDVYDEFLDALVRENEDLVVGDPMDEATDVGPQAREDLLRTLHRQVEESVEAGATVECGGEPLDRDGYYYPPTILTDVPEGCPAETEELFGPVSAVFEVADERAAIERANASRFGLSATVWTDDRERGERVARELDVGAAFVNEMAKSDPRLPFGGVKDSGYGRELSRHGIREFANRKTIWID
jgi:succinate-semialdehyde dehydrogenase/glutarate-semialdehyde dehydrogenase